MQYLQYRGSVYNYAVDVKDQRRRIVERRIRYIKFNVISRQLSCGEKTQEGNTALRRVSDLFYL